MPELGLATRTGERLQPDASRVVARLFVPGQELVGGGESRASAVASRILALDESEVERALADVMRRFDARHHALSDTFRHNAHRISGHHADTGLSDARRLLLGATFTHEYSVEGTALCNPSMVPDPDQQAAPDGGLRFVMSVRGIGEGHRSSIGFRSGAVHADGTVAVDAAGPRPVVGRVSRGSFDGEVTKVELDDAARSYTVAFPSATDLSERVLWPATTAESHGMEDARFVRFADDGRTIHYATYTAYDGVAIAQQLLETTDFVTFRVSPIVGPAAANKGLALFPRRIGGRFAALSRFDHETNRVAFSHDPCRWEHAEPFQAPRRPWETIQLGNCGPPIETSEGWLVLTHGVGPMRTYSIGAVLLDLDDPTRIIGGLTEPLLSPGADEQDGYVPNVVYSCGGLVHADTLVIPYGIADTAIGIATVPLAELMAAFDP